MWVTHGESIRDHPWNVTCVGPAGSKEGQSQFQQDETGTDCGTDCWDDWWRIKSPFELHLGCSSRKIRLVFNSSPRLKAVGPQNPNKHARHIFSPSRPFCIIWDDSSRYWDYPGGRLKPPLLREHPAGWSSAFSGGDQFSSTSVSLCPHLWLKTSKLQRVVTRTWIYGPSSDEDDENGLIQVGGSHRLFLLPPSLLGLVCEEENPAIVLFCPSYPLTSDFSFCRTSAVCWM